MEELQAQFTEYQSSYNELVVAVCGKRKPKKILLVTGQLAVAQKVRITLFSPDLRHSEIHLPHSILQASLIEMHAEEHEIRATFSAEQGSNPSADLCLCIEDIPLRWNNVPIKEHSSEGVSSGYRGDYREFLPTVDSDLLTEVCLTDVLRYYS